MEDLLTNAFNTGDLKIIIAALTVYVIIYVQRKDTKGKRDDAQSAIETRIALIEHDNSLLHEQMNTVSSKLDKIIDELCEIKVSIARKEEKK